MKAVRLAMVIVDWKVTAAASVELVGLFYLCSRSHFIYARNCFASQHRYAEDVRAPGGQPRSAARVLIQWQNPPAACRPPMLRLVSMSGDKGRGVRALPAAQACHMRRRRTLACQGRPCSRMSYEEEEDTCMSRASVLSQRHKHVI
jgi:hypothetical protein